MLLDELAGVFQLDLANLALIEDGGRRARVVAAREGGRDNEQLIGQELDLEPRPSGISTVVREGAAFAVFDAGELADRQPAAERDRAREELRLRAGARPRRGHGRRLCGRAQPAPVRRRRAGADADARSEAGLALARTRATAALGEALERERLIARISREVRSIRDLDELLGVAVEETAKAIRAERCLIRLGDPDDQAPLSAQWVAAAVAPLDDLTRLPVVNLAAREQRTFA